METLHKFYYTNCITVQKSIYQGCLQNIVDRGWTPAVRKFTKDAPQVMVRTRIYR